MGLTKQILVPLLVLLILMGGFMFSWSFYISRSMLENELRLDIAKSERIINLSLRNTLDQLSEKLLDLAASKRFSTAVEKRNKQTTDELLADLLESRSGYLLDMLTVYISGEKWLDSGLSLAPVVSLNQNNVGSFSDTPEWKAVPYIKKVGNKNVAIVYSAPIVKKDTGQVLGFLCGGLDLDINYSVLEILKQAASSKTAALLYSKNLLISSESEDSPQMSGLLSWGKVKDHGKYFIAGEEVYSSVPILEDHSTGLRLVYSRTNKTFHALTNEYKQNLAILLFLALVFSGLIAWGMHLRIHSALKKLTDYADRVASGETRHNFERTGVREFNRLGAVLQNTVQRLDNKNIYVSRLFDSARAPIINCDREGRILDMNPAAKKHVLRNSNRVEDRSIYEFFPESHLEKVSRLLGKAARSRTPAPAEIPLLQYPQEEKKYFVWTFSPVTTSSGEGTELILMQGHDITENRKILEQARLSEERLRQIIDLLPQRVYAKDFEGKFILVNRAMAESFNKTAADMTGKTSFEVYGNHKTVTRMIEDDRRVIERNEEVQLEESYIDANRDIHWLETTKVPYITQDTHTSAILTLSMDITRMKKAEMELQELNKELIERVSVRTAELEAANEALIKSMDELRHTQNRLVETEKMASLGELVAGIAHEINTPLGISVTSASYLHDLNEKLYEHYQNSTLKRSELENYFTKADETVDSLMKNLSRSAELVGSFKQLAVDQTSDDLREINLEKYIQDVLFTLKPKLIEKNHALDLQCPPDIEILTSPGALMQILTNLVNNSLIHAFPHGVEGVISIRFKKSGKGIILTFSDNGQGMKDEELRKVFDPFFTTKRSEGNTGLGMHLVYNLVTQILKGRIECKSAPGEGTTYEIWFPKLNNSGAPLEGITET